MVARANSARQRTIPAQRPIVAIDVHGFLLFLGWFNKAASLSGEAWCK